MIRAVVNASPLIALSIIEKFDLIESLFDEIYIPKAVVDEILAANGKRQFAVNELKDSLKKGSFQIYEVKDFRLVDKLIGKLHRGEVEVIVAAKEKSVDFAIIDEIAARNLSNIMSINTIGTIGILKLAKENGFIVSLKPLLLDLRKNKFHIQIN